MKKGDIRFKKIKASKEGKVSLVYEKHFKDELWDEYTMACSDRANPTFYKAMKDLTQYLHELCELPDECRDRLEVTGVSISYAGPMDTMGAVLIGKYELKDSNCPLNLVTPHKADMPYSGAEPEEADPNQLLPDGCTGAICRLCEEAQKYLDGEREQTELFDKKKDGKKAAAGKESAVVELELVK